MRLWLKYLYLALSVSLVSGPSLVSAADKAVVVREPAEAGVEVKDLRVEGDTVQGVVVNNSSHTVINVRMVIRHAWLWDSERNPGTDNPGRSELYSLPGEVAAGGRAPFTFDLKTKKTPREGGRFITTAEVLDYTMVSR